MHSPLEDRLKAVLTAMEKKKAAAEAEKAKRNGNKDRSNKKRRK